MTAALILMSFVVTADNAEASKLLKTFREEFIEITPGKGRYPKSFEMGGRKSDPASAAPVHKVTFEYHFMVGKYEVPQNLWEEVMGSNPSRWTGPRNSVEMLTFDEAEEFCRRATKSMRAAALIKAKQVIRLPSEAEWEYVARAGTKTLFSFGDDIKQLDAYGWHTGNAAGNDPPVGAKKPNPWGLYDVHGYLWEWCSDAGHENYEGAPADGSSWTKGGDAKRRVIRSGSWKDKDVYLSSGRRDCDFPSKGGRIKFDGGIPKNTRDDALGLRCVLANEN